MKIKYIILITILSLLIVLTIWNFPWLTRYWVLEIYYLNLKNITSMVIISDIHLESNYEDLSTIGTWLKRNNIAMLVIAGDLFDNKHYYMNYQELRSLLRDAVEKLNLTGINHIEYIVSETSHDPIITNGTITLNVNDVIVNVRRGLLMIKLDNCDNVVYVTHGDYISRDGVVAYIINYFFKILGYKLFLEKLLKNILNIPKNSWLIMGHTHISGIDYEARVANSGFWISRYGLSSSRTVILAKCTNEELIIKLTKLK